jgi:hypothetical protein
MIVRSGSPLKPGIAPLIPTRSWTIEGPERFGGSRQPTGGAGAWGGGRRPVGLGSNLVSRAAKTRVPRRLGPPTGRRGLFGWGLGAVGQLTVTNLRTGQSNSGGTGQSGMDFGPVCLPGDQLRFSLVGATPNAEVTGWFSWPGAPTYMAGLRDAAGDLLGWHGGMTDGAGNWSWTTTITAAMAGFWGAHIGVAGDIMGDNTYVAVWQVDGGVGTGTFGIQEAPTQLNAGTPNYALASNHPAAAGSVAPVVQTLQQELDARGITLPGSASTGPAAAAATKAGTLAFANLSTGDAAHFRVGDRWRVSISGASPNAPIVVTGVQNGKSDTTQLGVTDGSGSWSSSGTMDASTVGTWVESWKVGGLPAAQLSFTVSGPSGAGPLTGDATPAITPVDSSSFDVGGFLGGSVFGLPTWAVLAGAVGLVLVLGGSHHGR